MHTVSIDGQRQRIRGTAGFAGKSLAVTVLAAFVLDWRKNCCAYLLSTSRAVRVDSVFEWGATK